MTVHATALVTLREVEDSIRNRGHGPIPTKRFEIVLSATGETVGGITLRYADNEYLTLFRGHCGFEVDGEHRRRGYASAALVQVLAVARQLGMPRLVVTCQDGNVASEKTIRKAGLSYEATVDVPANTYLSNQGIDRVKRFSMTLGNG